MVTHETDYRTVLKKQFEIRSKRNPSYSLRAFAKHLGLAPTRLSDIFRKKQGLSLSSARMMAANLGFNNNESDYFCTLVEREHARSRMAREAARLRLEKYKQSPAQTLDLEYFTMISDWYHFAILELARLPSCSAKPAWLAQRLGITCIQAECAVERLTKLDLIEVRKGRLLAAPGFLATSSEVPSKAIQQYHLQILEKAMASIQLTPVKLRDFSAINLLVREDQIGAIKSRLQEFRRELLQGVETEPNRDRLYCFSMQLFPLEKEITL